MNNKRLKILKSSDCGQAIVEFSIVAAILLMLAGGAIDAVQIMRYQIALNAAVSEVCCQITNTGDVETICDKVIYINYKHILGDGKTVYSIPGGDIKARSDGREYKYYNYNLDQTDKVWSGKRYYVPVTIKMSREQPLLSPFGRLVFGDEALAGKRKIESTAMVRLYEN